MVGRFVSRLSAIAAFFAIASSAVAQTGSITGKVTDANSGKPLGAANVQAVSGTRTAGTAVTGADGSYRLTGLPFGSYSVVATKIGYAPKRTEGITVSAGGATASFALSEFAVQLNPVVTTASPNASGGVKYLEAPAAISVVSAERISAKPVTSIAEFLKTVPGLSVSSAGLVQSNTVSRGFNNAFSGAMLNLQDYRFAGVPSLRVNVPFLYTGTNEDIERIEVLNGPAAALYGPNSANGVLHIITKSPFQSKGTSLSVDGGGRALIRGSGRTAWVFGDKDEWGFKLSGEYLSGTDWPYTDPNLPAVYPNTAPAGRRGLPIVRDLGVRHYGAEGRLDYRASGSDLENILTAGYTKLLRGIELTTSFGPVLGKNWSYESFQDRFRYKKFFAQVFYNGSNSGNDGPSDTTGTYAMNTGIPFVDQSTVTVGQVQQGFDLLKAKMVVGADYIATEPKSQGTIFGRNEGNTSISEYGAYLQAAVPLNPKLDFTGAARLDQTNRLAGSQFSPRLALVYKYDSANNLRFTFSRAFNSPASFEYFLDQYIATNVAPGGYNVRATGNPPKTGWQFDRSCDATINAGLCMHSPFVSQGALVPVASSAAAAFPGFVNSVLAANPGLAGLMPILRSLTPTAAQVGTVLSSVLGASVPVAASAVTDLAPLTPGFNNTWEVGYKGIIGERLRIAVDAWYQVRSGVGQVIAQNTPVVLFEPTSLQNYLTAAFTAAGLPAPVAAGTAAGIVSSIKLAPLGTVTFNNPTLAPDHTIIYTYRQGLGEIDVRGLDVALDYQANDYWMLAATYSNQDKIVFPEIGGAANPLMSNSPKYRASGTARYNDDANGFGFETTVRYMDAFPVNSGYFNSLSPNPVVGSRFPYDPINAQTQVDIGVSYKLPIAQKVTWSLNVSNLLDNREPTFPGTPSIGRLVITRLRYAF